MPPPDPSGQSVPAPWLFDNGVYNQFKTWFDAEDVVAGLSYPLIKSLWGESPGFRDALMGFFNQIAARNTLLMAGMMPESAALHSLKSIIAGALFPIEHRLLHGQKYRSEG